VQLLDEVATKAEHNFRAFVDLEIIPLEVSLPLLVGKLAWNDGLGRCSVGHVGISTVTATVA
jgi:hypothetical protein